MRLRETDELFKILVSQLAYTLMPTTVMGVTIATTGLFAYKALGNIGLLLSVVLGGVASAGKIILMLAHQRFNDKKQATVEQAAQWELAHGLLTFVVAASVGWLASQIFLSRELSVQLLATGMLFGYCAGVSSRIAVRPYLAAATITIAAVPAIMCAALNDDPAHWLLTGVFLVFLAAAMQSIWHAYHLSTRQIGLRLEMEHQARHDPLTGLRNRIALAEAFAALKRGETSLTCLHCFDLDGFKIVNDRFGHMAGDELLAAIGGRLRELQGADMIPVRMGGDEFVVLQTSMTSAAEAEVMAARILNALRLPYIVSGVPTTVGISLGYTVERSSNADLSTMMRLADAASYRVKRQGGGIDREVPATVALGVVSSAA
ncbi:MAG TPA: GGDEF domain-containing protein [Ensifer sp.]|nr:GGDEF domain-containing protein [Ensifer sp.]